jgi:uncharacterized membrane protein YheB (UPF0754 family)
MEIFFIIIVMMVIGGIIGGFTNFLAIKMLFRPYRAYYIGKWRVPFTPGLIPRRRDELAKQLGKMVVSHLLTPESLKKKFTQKEFVSELTNFAQTEISKILDTERSLVEVLEQFHLVDSKTKLKQQLDIFIENTYERFSSKYRNQPLKLVVPSQVQEKIEMKIPVVSEFIVNKGIDYFSSVEGKLRIQRMFDDFLKERGMLGNMLQMFLGNVSLADKIQPELIKFLSSEGTTDLLNTLLYNEWAKLSERQFEEIEAWLEKEKIIGLLKQYSHRVINIDEIMDRSVQFYVSKYKEVIISKGIPKLVDILGEWLSNRIETIMDKIHLAQLVREQVETFSVERLEELVFSIISSELKMITNLGFLLGAIIGLLQGILAVFI